MDPDWYDDEYENLSDDAMYMYGEPFYDDVDFSSPDYANDDLWGNVALRFSRLQFTAPQEIIEKPTAEVTAPLLKLPNEIILQIFEYQDKADRIIFGLACRRLLQLLAMLPPSAVTIEMDNGNGWAQDPTVTERARSQLLSCRRRYPMLHPCSMFPRIVHADEKEKEGGVAYEEEAREKDKDHNPEDSNRPTESGDNDSDAPAEIFERELDESLQKLLDARAPARAAHTAGSGSPVPVPWEGRPVWYAEHAVAKRCLDCSVHQGQTWWNLCRGCCKYLPRSPLYWQEFSVSDSKQKGWSNDAEFRFNYAIDHWTFDNSHCPSCEVARQEEVETESMDENEIWLGYMDV